MAFHVYIVASAPNGPLYVGMTDNLGRRVDQHRSGSLPGFTRKHRVSRLVWCEAHETRETAFVRERQIKEWRRSWKLELIEASNPTWADLYETLHF